LHASSHIRGAALMAAVNFDRALAAVLKHEGGYADHPRDPGGATNLGVTRATLARWRGRPVSKAEVRALTRAEAAKIYRALYWDEIAGDALPDGLDLAVFDYCVNSGPGRAARALQAVAGTRGDGRIGKITLACVALRDPEHLIIAYCRKRLTFLERLRTFAVFGRGWRRRVDETQALALEMAREQKLAA
jgi:lysozyme family protein